MPRPRKSINQINVVPYIDVMLVLLIIFMVTAPLISPGQIELPTVGKPLTTPPAPPLEITVRRDGSLWLRDQALNESPRKVSHEDMIARIRQKQQANREQSVVIAADRAVRYDDVIRVIDLLQQNQVTKVGLLATSTK